MRLIIVAGMPGAGKEEFLTAAREEGLAFVRMGDLVRDCYAASGAEAQGLSVGQYANAQREAEGKDVWARRAMAKAAGDVFLIDGCRSMDEVRSFRALGGQTEIVAIHASPAVRYDRLVRRAREDAPRDQSEFEARDNRELAWGLGEVIALADYMLDNMSSVEDFRLKSTALLRSL